MGPKNHVAYLMSGPDLSRKGHFSGILLQATQACPWSMFKWQQRCGLWLPLLFQLAIIVIIIIIIIKLIGTKLQA